MKPRAIVLTLGVLIAAWLAFFSEPPPQAEIAQAIVRSSASTNANNKADTNANNKRSSSVTANKKSKAEEPIAIEALIDRKDLLGREESKPAPCAAAPAPATMPTMPTIMPANLPATKPSTAAIATNAGKVAAAQKKKGSAAAPCIAAAPSERLFDAQSWTPPPPPPLPPPPPPPPSAPPLPFTYIGKKLDDGKWEVYLARGDKVEIIKDNMKIDGIYQIDKITPPTLILLYLPLQQKQTIHIGGSD